MDELMSLLPKSPEDLQDSAQRISVRASEHAADEEFDSPYTVAAKKNGEDLSFWEKLKAAKLSDGKLQLGELSGGKVDDITVCVAMVVQSTDGVSLGEWNNFETIETSDLREGKGLEVNV